MTRSARVSPMLASSNNGSMAPRSAASLTPLLLTAKYSCCAGLEWAFAQANRPRVQAARLANMMFLRFMARDLQHRSEEHTSELQSLMRISYADFCLNKKI